MNREDDTDRAHDDEARLVEVLLGGIPRSDPAALADASRRLWRTWAERTATTRAEIAELRSLLAAEAGGREGNRSATEGCPSPREPGGHGPSGSEPAARTQATRLDPEDLVTERRPTRDLQDPPSFGHRTLPGRWLASLVARAVLWLARPLTVRQQEVNEETARDLERLRRALVALDERAASFDDRLVKLEDRLRTTEAEIGTVLARAHDVESESRRAEALAQSTSRLENAFLRQALVEQGIALAWSSARTAAHGVRLGRDGGGADPDSRHGAPEGSTERLSDEVYFALQERFRGDRDLVRSRCQVYLPRIAEAGCVTAEHPLLDLGCGRGEWLELLGEEGHEAVGVDGNPYMVGVCRDRGLRVTHDDVFRFLASKDAGSYGAVTALHLVEHLTFSRMLDLLGEVRRVMRPGAWTILESPNPHCLPASAMNFHCDPTHVRPIPPELLAFALECLSFTDIEILPLAEHRGVRPIAADFPGADGDAPLRRVIDVLDSHLLAPPDYAVVARWAPTAP